MSSSGRGPVAPPAQVTTGEHARPTFLNTPPASSVPPPRSAMTTREALDHDIRVKEVEMSVRPEPPPSPAAVLELVAEEVRRLRKELADVKSAQRQRTELTRKSFDWMKFLGGLGTTLPFVALVWGEWIKANPKAGGTVVGSIITALFGAVKLLQARPPKKRDDDDDGAAAVATADVQHQQAPDGS